MNFALAVLATCLVAVQPMRLFELSPAKSAPLFGAGNSDREHYTFGTHFDAYVKHYNKTYSGTQERQSRYETFKKHYTRMVEHNAAFEKGRHSFSLGVSEYFDMDHEELVQTMNGFKRSTKDRRRGATFMEPNFVSVPDTVDWREHGYVTPVKNQGQCGSCWAFSTTGSMEGQTFRKTSKLTSLSEQNLVDCSKKWGNNGCEGGLMDNGFDYIHDNGGIDTERSYPYEAKDAYCRYSKRNIGATDKTHMDIEQGNEQQLKVAVATQGPVSVAIDASHESFQLYRDGVYYEERCSSEQLDHGVLVVGYGTSDNGEDYWLVKNSWGPSWGMDGYVRMARNRENNCGIASSASYPIV